MHGWNTQLNSTHFIQKRKAAASPKGGGGKQRHPKRRRGKQRHAKEEEGKEDRERGHNGKMKESKSIQKRKNKKKTILLAMWTILLCGNSLLGAREVGRRSGEEERRGHNKGGRKAKEYHKGINTKARKDKHGGRSERAPYTICSTTTFLPCWSNIFVSCQFFLSSL